MNKNVTIFAAEACMALGTSLDATAAGPKVDTYVCKNDVFALGVNFAF